MIRPPQQGRGLVARRGDDPRDVPQLRRSADALRPGAHDHEGARDLGRRLRLAGLRLLHRVPGGRPGGWPVDRSRRRTPRPPRRRGRLVGRGRAAGGGSRARGPRRDPPRPRPRRVADVPGRRTGRAARSCGGGPYARDVPALRGDGGGWNAGASPGQRHRRPLRMARRVPRHCRTRGPLGAALAGGDESPEGASDPRRRGQDAGGVAHSRDAEDGGPPGDDPRPPRPPRDRAGVRLRNGLGVQVLRSPVRPDPEGADGLPRRQRRRLRRGRRSSSGISPPVASDDEVTTVHRPGSSSRAVHCSRRRVSPGSPSPPTRTSRSRASSRAPPAAAPSLPFATPTRSRASRAAPCPPPAASSPPSSRSARS